MTTDAIRTHALAVGANVHTAPLAGNLIATLHEILGQVEEQQEMGNVRPGEFYAPHAVDQAKMRSDEVDWHVRNADGVFIANFTTQGDALYACQVLDMIATRRKPERRRAWAVDLRIVFDADTTRPDVAERVVYDAIASAGKAIIGTLITNEEETAYSVEFPTEIVDGEGQIDHSYIQSGRVTRVP